MSAREAIIANIRRSLGVTGAEEPRRFEVETRLARAPAGVVPKRGQGDAGTRVATFKAEAARAAASLAEVVTLADVPEEVARFLRENNAPASLRMGADERLAAMPWSPDAARNPARSLGRARSQRPFGRLRGHRRDGDGCARIRRGQSDDAQLPARQSDRRRQARRHPRRLRKRLPEIAGSLRQGCRATHGQFHHRPIALGRYRTDPAPRRAWAAAPPHRDRRVSARCGRGRAAAAARKPLCESRNPCMAYVAQRRPLRSGALSCGRVFVR